MGSLHDCFAPGRGENCECIVISMSVSLSVLSVYIDLSQKPNSRELDQSFCVLTVWTWLDHPLVAFRITTSYM